MKENRQGVSLNKMGTENVSKIMLSMGVPMILSMVLQACYKFFHRLYLLKYLNLLNLLYKPRSSE